MRFALFGDHPDGLDMARTVGESGRHQLAVYSGPPVGEQYLRRWGLRFDRVGDLEAALADPAVDAVIVAGGPADRPNQLRRALQSEKHVLCVHPAAETPESVYEAAILQTDTAQVLVPLLPAAFHPGVQRLAALLAAGRPQPPRLLELERWSAEGTLLDAQAAGHRPGFPDWEVLRCLGGEIAEVSAYALRDEVAPDEPILLAGRFERGGLFQGRLLPHQPTGYWRIAALLRYDRAELVFPDGWPGPARLTRRDDSGRLVEESWGVWNPWPGMLELFEQAAERHRRPAADKRPPAAAPQAGGLSWEDEVRCVELDDAARRSIERRRASTLEYQEDTEDASFKGTMTLMGCAMIWVSLLLLIFSRWVPWLGWLIAPLFGVFLLMQFLRWVIPPREAGLAAAGRKTGEGPPERQAGDSFQEVSKTV